MVTPVVRIVHVCTICKKRFDPKVPHRCLCWKCNTKFVSDVRAVEKHAPALSITEREW